MSTSSPNEALNEESPGNEAEIKRKYSLDVHPSLYEDTSKLIDRYFDVVAPLWQVVVPSDLNHQPFASPLLVRAICLLSALSLPVVNSIFITQVTESIHQCFDAEDLLSLPSISTLQALLLLLACPGFSQRSIMVSSALRMASILGFNRAQSPRPILYWSCVAWARWDAIMLRGSSGINGMPHVLAAFDPDESSFFGRIYYLLAKAETGVHADLSLELGTRHAHSPGMYRDSPEDWLHLLDVFLLGSPARWKSLLPIGMQERDHVWLRFMPFHQIQEQLQRLPADDL